MPNLLKGLIFDSHGRLMTPKHGTKKTGIRFRYYVCSAAAREDPHAPPAFGNLPAHDAEQVVINALRGLLMDGERLCGLAGEARQDVFVDHGRHRLTALDAAPPGEVARLIRSLVARVEVHDDHVKTYLNRPAFITYLCTSKTTLPHEELSLKDAIELKTKVCLRRFKRQMRLTVTDHTIDQHPLGPNPSILKALARAYVWNKGLRDGTIPSIRELCRQENFNERYVMRILKLAYLSPKQTEKLLAGKHGDKVLGEIISEAGLVW